MYNYNLFTAISNFEVEKSLWRPYLSPLYKILAHYLPDLKLCPLT